MNWKQSNASRQRQRACGLLISNGSQKTPIIIYTISRTRVKGFGKLFPLTGTLESSKSCRNNRPCARSLSPPRCPLVCALYALRWFGLQHSTPLAATIISLLSRTVLLWTAVIFTGGIPVFASLAMIVFVILGILQSVTSL